MFGFGMNKMKTIYYFTADWCAPCKKTRPIVEHLMREQKEAGFQIIDADSEIELVKKFNIISIPTFILLLLNLINFIKFNFISCAFTFTKPVAR